ncbi:unnamed protein product [Gordionus sp. m RMFG-2023]
MTASFLFSILILASFKITESHNKNHHVKEPDHDHFGKGINPLADFDEERHNKILGKPNRFHDTSPEENDLNSFWDELDDLNDLEEESHGNDDKERNARFSKSRKGIKCTYNIQYICGNRGKRFRGLPGCRKFVDCDNRDKRVFKCGLGKVFHQAFQSCRKFNPKYYFCHYTIFKRDNSNLYREHFNSDSIHECNDTF